MRIGLNDVWIPIVLPPYLLATELFSFLILKMEPGLPACLTELLHGL